jgi:hypothetical protein
MDRSRGQAIAFMTKNLNFKYSEEPYFIKMRKYCRVILFHPSSTSFCIFLILLFIVFNLILISSIVGGRANRHAFTYSQANAHTDTNISVVPGHLIQ